MKLYEDRPSRVAIRRMSYSWNYTFQITYISNYMFMPLATYLRQTMPLIHLFEVESTNVVVLFKVDMRTYI